jgi:proline iminopeptidase
MRVEVNGVRLFVDVEGAMLVPDGSRMREKPTLLLLHGGLGAEHSGLKSLGTTLADVAQVVYVDQRGGGRSDRSDARYWTLDQWADDVRGLCDALGIARPFVYGVSFGGFVAMNYAIRHPEHPAGLILASTFAQRRPDRNLAAWERVGGREAREAFERTNDDASPEAFAEFVRVCGPLYHRRPLRDPDARRRELPDNVELRVHVRLGGEMERYNLLPRLADVRCPVLVIGGEDDPVAPIESQEEIVRALPRGRARFERIPDCSHAVFNDAPERVTAAIREFVGSARE